MIQIYKPANNQYDKNGDMVLLPTSAKVYAILNNSWTAELTHPIDSLVRWKYIEEEAVIKMPSFNGEQLFRIKKVSKSDSEVTAEMEPIFMDSMGDCFLIDVRPTEKTGQQALDIMCAANNKYSGSSDILTVSTAYYEYKNLVEAINGDDENSFIKRWGGEILFDNFSVIINERVGGDYGVELKYGKNIPENGMSEEIDTSAIITRIYPKAYNGYSLTDNGYVDSPIINSYPTIKAATITFEDVKMREDAQEGDEENGVIVCDTQEELDEALTEKCNEQYSGGVDKPQITISADMVLLKNTEQYKDYAILEDVSLGDTIHCKHSRLGIVTDARVIELEYDCIRKKAESVVLGDFQYNYFNDVTSATNRIESAIRDDGSVVAEQVRGIIDGVKSQMRAQSSIAKKQNVRAIIFEDFDAESPTYGAMCLGTMGFQIASERTADGRDWDWSTFGTGKGFFADFIVAGTMLADRIKGGTLELGGSENGNGIARVMDSEGYEVVRLDKDGVYARGKYICEGTTRDIYVTVNDGYIEFSDNAGNSAYVRASTAQEGSGKIMIYPDQGSSIQRYLSISSTELRAQFGSIVLWSTGTITLSCNSLNLQKGGSGYTGKSGRAEFSDGTYLNFVNGICVGGNTKEGAF